MLTRSGYQNLCEQSQDTKIYLNIRVFLNIRTNFGFKKISYISKGFSKLTAVLLESCFLDRGGANYFKIDLSCTGKPRIEKIRTAISLPILVWSATEYMYDVEQKTVYAAVMVINDGWRLLNGMIYLC